MGFNSLQGCLQIQNVRVRQGQVRGAKPTPRKQTASAWFNHNLTKERCNR